MLVYIFLIIIFYVIGAVGFIDNAKLNISPKSLKYITILFWPFVVVFYFLFYGFASIWSKL